MRAETKLYFNDTLDHSISLIEMVETQRDMLIGLIEMHLSLPRRAPTRSSRFLTIVSAIFIPLTFVAGIWGMNFDPATSPWNMPELEAYYGYPAALWASWRWLRSVSSHIFAGRNGFDVTIRRNFGQMSWPVVEGRHAEAR